MAISATNPHLPDVATRRAVRVRPAGKPVMYQKWRDLLFLHWEYSVAAIQATLPEGLFVDAFGGRAFLGIVPFFMRNIRPRFLPAHAHGRNRRGCRSRYASDDGVEEHALSVTG